MSTDTMPDTTQKPAAGTAPAWMPPPAPGTGLTTATPEPARPAATQQVAPAAATQQVAPAAATQQVAPAADRGVTSAATTSRVTTVEEDTTPLGRRLLAGAVWGPVAMGAAALLQMWSSALGGDVAVRPLRLLTTITGGGANLVDGSVLQGILANVLLGVTFGVLFALVAPRLHGARAVLVGALVFGAGIFAVDHYLIATQYPLLELRDDALLLGSRLVFAAVLAIGFLPSSTAE